MDKAKLQEIAESVARETSTDQPASTTILLGEMDICGSVDYPEKTVIVTADNISKAVYAQLHPSWLGRKFYELMRKLNKWAESKR